MRNEAQTILNSLYSAPAHPKLNRTMQPAAQANLSSLCPVSSYSVNPETQTEVGRESSSRLSLNFTSKLNSEPRT